VRSGCTLWSCSPFCLEEVVPLPDVAGIPLPTALLVGGALAGMLLALLARVVNGIGARRRARRAARSLRARVAQVGDELVIGPVEDELAVHARLDDALARALGERRRRPSRRRGQQRSFAAETATKDAFLVSRRAPPGSDSTR
jgi:hypothetical protein